MKTQAKEKTRAKKETGISQKIIPHLWFDSEAEEAAILYTSLFENSDIGTKTHYSKEGFEIHGQQEGKLMTIEFELAGQQFIGLNGGPHFKFMPAISFIVHCKSEEEVDRLWDELSKDGEVLMPLDKYNFSEKYGWTEDRFGLSWQIMLTTEKVPQKIMPSLLFVGDVYGKTEEAINFYTSVFDDAQKKAVFHYGPDQEPNDEEAVMYGDFELDGQFFAAMDSALEHDFTFNEAISFLIQCEDQKEIDYYWDKLSADPNAEQCGWLKDKFGVSWQVSPTILNAMLNNSDKEKVDRATKAFLQMKKLDINKLKDAYEGTN